MILLGSLQGKDCDECDALIRDYYARSNASDGMSKLAINWQRYAAMERAGACFLFLDRDEQLNGFALYMLYDHMHHEAQCIAQCTMIGVQLEARGKGVGRGLIEAAILFFKPMGVTHVVHQHRLIYDTEPLFEKLGFKKIEVSYMKELG
jgi:GNAT superfamily N-acetyltransferase